MIRFVLGSQSPRRKEILSIFNLPFEQVSPTFDEETIPFTGNPSEYVCKLSKGKADSLAPALPNATILTADTIVYFHEKIYGKPKNEKEAFQTLSELSGQWHSVFTGITVRTKNQEFHQAEETRVLFNVLTPDKISLYLSKFHWSDKAAGYVIQTGGGLLIRKINGCFYNVMGLPMNTVRELFLQIGIDLWNYIR